MCVPHTTDFRTFEQTLQPVLFSYSLSLNLLITSPFMVLFSVELMVSSSAVSGLDKNTFACFCMRPALPGELYEILPSLGYCMRIWPS